MNSSVNTFDHVLWTEKYRPTTVDQTILPAALKQTFQQFVDSNTVPNLILAGGPGCGKTTVARAMIEQLGSNYLIVNGSLNLNLDALRNEIREFASSVSLNGKRKYVIVDEADYLNHHIQPALRNFIEEFAKTCGFVFTCNFKHKIIDPLHSRCSVIDFKFTKQDNPTVAKHILARTIKILDNEKIEYDKKVVIELIKKHYPDFRRMINELQRYSVGGSIDSGILRNFDQTTFNNLIAMIKGSDFSGIRKWVAESDVDESELYRRLYDASGEQVASPAAAAQLILILAKYQYQSAFCADKQINLMACLIEIMADVEFR